MEEILREYGLALIYGILGTLLIGCFVSAIGQLSF